MYKELEECTYGDIVIIDGVMLIIRNLKIDSDGDLALLNVGSTSVTCMSKEILSMDWQYINLHSARIRSDNIYCIGSMDSFAKVIEENFK